MIELAQVIVENKRLKEQQREQDPFNRRYDIIMTGFPENKKETNNDCKNIVYNTLEYAGFKLPRMAIEFAHRSGHRSNQKRGGRPILIKFHHLADRHSVI